MKKFWKIIKWIIVIAFLFFAWFVWDYVTRPYVNEINSKKIEISEEPFQDPNINIESISFESSDGQIDLLPVAKFDISALVVGRTNYYWDPASEFETTDLALAWDRVADSEYNQGIKFSQGGRWYHFTYSGDVNLPENYISNHSVNLHVVPATENIKKAARKIKKNQLVNLQGYLIDIETESFSQKTSRVRTDTGSGACEIMYVQRLQVDDKVYE